MSCRALPARSSRSATASPSPWATGSAATMVSTPAASRSRSAAYRSQAAPAQQRRGGARQVDDGRLDADGAGATVEDVVDVAAEVGDHVIGGGRADPAEAVGAGGGDRAAERLEQGVGQGMGRYPDADG